MMVGLEKLFFVENPYAALLDVASVVLSNIDSVHIPFFFIKRC